MKTGYGLEGNITEARKNYYEGECLAFSYAILLPKFKLKTMEKSYKY